MWKVLIIDDEKLAMQFLSSLIDWHEADCETPVTALTAERAMTLFHEIWPDIVFVDIRMPGTDGLTLSRKMRQIKPDCQINILTAYRDFDYARQAVSIGTSTFLLKHEIDAQQLRSVLEKNIHAIKQAASIRMSALEGWIRRCVLNGIFELPPEGLLDVRGHYGLLICKRERWPELGESTDPFTVWSREDAVLAKTAVGSRLRCLLIRLDKADRLRIIAERLFHEAGEQATIVYTAMDLSSDGAKEAPAGQQIASETLLPVPAVLSWEAYGKMPVCNVAFPLDYIHRAEEKIHLSAEDAEEWALAPLQSLTNAGRAATERFRPALMLIARLCNETSTKPEQVFRQVRASMQHPANGSVDELEAVLRLLIAHRKTAWQAQEHTKGTDYAREAARIIRRDYGHPLTSTDIACKLYVSEGYLRSVFKRAYHCTIKDFLRQTRIEVACEMLLTRKYKIYEIAERCGFSSGQHFSQVFKQEKGVTPLEFQSMSMGHEP